MQGDVRVGVHRPHETARRVELESRDRTLGVTFPHPAECVVGEAGRLSRAVGPRRELPRRIVLVVQHPAVEVGLPHEPACLVVDVGPVEPVRRRHARGAEVGVVAVLKPRPVGQHLPPRQVEVGRLDARGASHRVGVGHGVALAVVAPVLRGAVRVGPGHHPALDVVAEACASPERVDGLHDAAEQVPHVAHRGAGRVGDRHGEPGRVGADGAPRSGLVHGRDVVSALVVGVPAGRARGVGQREEVAALVVVVAPDGPVRVGHGDRQAELVVLGARPRAVGSGDGDEVAVRVIGVVRGPPECVGPSDEPVVFVPLGPDARAERVRPHGDVAPFVEHVGGDVAERVGEARGPVAGVVGEGSVQEAAGALVGDTAPLGVVEVAVPLAVAVDPPREAALRVVVEPHRPARRVHDLGERPGVVVAVAQNRGLPAALTTQAQLGHPTLFGGHVDVVAAVVAHSGDGPVGVAVDVDAVAVAVGDRGQPCGPRRRGGGEVQHPGRPAAGHRVAVLGAPQWPPGAEPGQHPAAPFRHRVHEDHAVVGDVDHAVGVELQPLVHCGRPRAAERLARAVSRDVGAAEHERQDAGQRQIGLPQHNLAAGDVDRVVLAHPEVLRRAGRLRVLRAGGVVGAGARTAGVAAVTGRRAGARRRAVATRRRRGLPCGTAFVAQPSRVVHRARRRGADIACRAGGLGRAVAHRGRPAVDVGHALAEVVGGVQGAVEVAGTAELRQRGAHRRDAPDDLLGALDDRPDAVDQIHDRVVDLDAVVDELDGPAPADHRDRQHRRRLDQLVDQPFDQLECLVTRALGPVGDLAERDADELRGLRVGLDPECPRGPDQLGETLGRITRPRGA